ncbi:NAD(P)/FAD-dependent oxidoreductase [Flavobacterium sp.]|uniref:NAD(P)/FAD-dependent oxidoreductase n=1 Tax=Flavobacterium sp. TaxID=239 RepID=UPI0039E45C16
MNLKAGFPFWLIKDGLPYTFPKLDRDIEAPVVIIGAGISGALVRYYLLKAGIRCVTVDARTIGLGSTCASTSLLQYEIDTPLCELIGMVGKEHAERAYQLCGYAIHELGKIANELQFEEYEFKKSLYYAAYKKDAALLKREFKARQEAGFKLRYLDEKAVKETFGIDSYGAILSDLAAQTNAYAFAHRLLQYKIDDESNVYDRTPVTNIKHHKHGVRLETENGFTINAQKLVYATGYEVVEFIDKKIVQLLSTYAVISEQYPTDRFWNDNVLIWNTADPYLYMRTTPDGRILIGGRDELFYHPDKRDALIGKKSKQLEQDFHKIFPNLPFKPEFSWTGTFGATKDGLPYIGEYKKLPHSYFALGFGGNGITFSLIAAEIIRDLILGKDNKDASIFAFDR